MTESPTVAITLESLTVRFLHWAWKRALRLAIRAGIALIAAHFGIVLHPAVMWLIEELSVRVLSALARWCGRRVRFAALGGWFAAEEPGELAGAALDGEALHVQREAEAAAELAAVAGAAGAAVVGLG